MVVKHTLTTVLSTKFDIDPARPPSSDGTSRFQDIGTALAALLPLLEVKYGSTDAGCIPLCDYVGHHTTTKRSANVDVWGASRGAGSAAHLAESTAEDVVPPRPTVRKSCADEQSGRRRSSIVNVRVSQC